MERNTHLKRVLDIEVYNKWGADVWAQGRYLVHGYNDVLWTDDIDEALKFLKEGLIR